MACIKLVIDTSSGNLLVSELSQAFLDPSTIKLNAGDTPQVQIILMAKIAVSGTGFPYQAIPVAGVTPTLYISDGVLGGTNYVTQTAWTPDPAGGAFWTANVPLTTAGLIALFASSKTANVTLQVGYVQNGFPNTPFNKPITMGVGSPGAAVTPNVGLTPISLEVANSLYLTKAPVTLIQLISPLGVIINLTARDNGDGTASINPA